MTASFGLRCGALALDLLLSGLTLGVGWLIWLLVVARRGQAPGKQVLGLRVLRGDGSQAGWGRTVLRELLVTLVPLSLLLTGMTATGGVALALIVGTPLVFLAGALLMLRTPRSQTIWDKAADTLVACRDDRPAVLRADP